MRSLIFPALQGSPWEMRSFFQTSGYRDWVNSARGHRYDHFHAIGNPIRVGSDNLIS